MRLWHEEIISKLPRQWLLGQHRECAALRGNGWGKPHSTVNYVFEYNPYKLYQYHMLVIEEIEKRGYNIDKQWKKPEYRGKVSKPYQKIEVIEKTTPIYPEHGNEYMNECIENLKKKGIELDDKCKKL